MRYDPAISTVVSSRRLASPVLFLSQFTTRCCQAETRGVFQVLDLLK